MTESANVPTLQRPSYFDGQRLTAADLAAAQRYDRELRWLHNRGLHTWGIAFGLLARGARGARSVVVEPGYAQDDQGRELILAEALNLPVPAVAGAPSGGPATYYLTASYAADADLPIAESRAGICLDGGAVRRPETARIRWQDPTDPAAESRYQRSRDVLLATALVQNCQLAAPLSLAERRDARPARQPYLAAGATPEGATHWTLWPNEQAPLGVETTVDTAAAGFGTTPHYMAHVAGDRLVSSAAMDPMVLDGFSHVDQPTPTSFLLQVVLPRNLTAGSVPLNPDTAFAELLRIVRRELRWYVVWLGVEG